MDRTNRVALRLIGEIFEKSSESVRAITAAESNRFSQALEALNELARKAKIPIALVGGMAATHYGFRGGTDDIDVVVGKDDLDQFLMYAPQFGFKVAWRSKTGWHTLEHGDVEINVVPEGGKAKNTSPTTIPGPGQLGVEEGLGVACLAGWVELKLATGRAKDLGHISELMKKASESEITACRNHLRGIHSDYFQEFERLLNQVEEEKEQERERGGHRH
jgi:hypothetical protein